MPRARSIVVALVLLLQLPATVTADEPDPPASEAPAAYAPDRVLVAWRAPGHAAATMQSHGLRAGQELGGGAPRLVHTNGRPVPDVVAELRRDPNVLYAEPDYVVRLDEGEVTAVPVNDPKTSGQYSLDAMRVRDAWSISTGAGNLIAVLDTGVQFSHPDLAGRVVAGHDFVNDDADASDDNGHGTWVAGILAARTNDGYGVAGISWSDKILPVKIMNANGSGYTSNLVSGIRWAADQGAKVINMSIGGYPDSASVQDAVDYAWGKGAVLVGAAGNNRREETHFPASHDHVVSVSATQADDEFTNWSSYGKKVDVSAPGASVLTTNCDKTVTPSCAYAGEHIIISGTSFASPNAAGVVALLRARYPSWTPQQIVDRLIATSDDLGYAGWDKFYGRGRVNALRALGGSVASPPIAAGDGLEPNNALAAARAISLGVTVSPTIHPAGDVDYFAVDVPRAGRLDVTVTAVVDTSRPAKSSLPVDPIVELLTKGGTRLAFADDPSSSATTEVASTTVSGPMRVIIRVANWFPNGSRTSYTVRANYVDTAPPLVSGRFPLPGATGLNRFVGPTVTFNEAVTNVSGATVSLRHAGTNQLVPTSVAYSSAVRQARITVSEQLAALAEYRVTVSGVRDVAGNTIAPVSWTFTTGRYGFYDIGASAFQTEIAWLAEAGVTAGCGVGRFCPTSPVTREQMASFLVRVLELPATNLDFFTDDEASAHESDINRLAASGVTTGCGPGRFCPSTEVTRAQMATFLARALELAPTSTDYFADDDGSSHEGDINRVAAAGVTAGCGPGRFCPDATITREQMAAFLMRAFGP